jgi:hypothetical protein
LIIRSTKGNGIFLPQYILKLLLNLLFKNDILDKLISLCWPPAGISAQFIKYPNKVRLMMSRRQYLYLGDVAVELITRVEDQSAAYELMQFDAAATG